jgi:ComF family protein
MLAKLLQFLYPARCRSCETLIDVGEVFCDICISKIKPVVSLIVPINQAYQLKIFAISGYQDPLKSLILKKFSYDLLASRQLAQLMLQLTDVKDLSVDCIVPIPLHWTRYAWRGYNQAHEMAHVLGKGLGKPVLSVVQRSKKTVFQSRLPIDQRTDNVKSAFSIALKYKFSTLDCIRDKHILLIDDLCTTGATLKSAAKILTRFKPKSISALVACRAV